MSTLENSHPGSLGRWWKNSLWKRRLWFLWSKNSVSESSLWQRLMINDDWLWIITDGLSTLKSDEAWWEKIQLMQSLRVNWCKLTRILMRFESFGIVQVVFCFKSYKFIVTGESQRFGNLQIYFLYNYINYHSWFDVFLKRRRYCGRWRLVVVRGLDFHFHFGLGSQLPCTLGTFSKGQKKIWLGSHPKKT